MQGKILLQNRPVVWPLRAYAGVVVSRSNSIDRIPQHGDVGHGLRKINMQAKRHVSVNESEFVPGRGRKGVQRGPQPLPGFRPC